MFFREYHNEGREKADGNASDPLGDPNETKTQHIL